MFDQDLINKHLNIPSPISSIDSKLFREKNVKLFVKRDDLIHPEISGNKWRKLFLNLLEANDKNQDTILTFGGAFSNHIYATAAACNLLGFKSIGIIRGEHVDELNHTLNFATSKGMKIVRVSKAIYGKDKKLISDQYPYSYVIPEGGNNDLGREGMKYLADELNSEFKENPTYVITPIGTGCTISGLIDNLSNNFNVLGINVLKNLEIEKQISLQLKNAKSNYSIYNDYHFGGYAKTTDDLIDFANHFSNEHNIYLDPIYTAKMMFAVYDLIHKNTFPEGAKIVCIHTGGLQGIKSYNRLKGKKVKWTE